jgi:hypothetical protein
MRKPKAMKNQVFKKRSEFEIFQVGHNSRKSTTILFSGESGHTRVLTILLIAVIALGLWFWKFFPIEQATSSQNNELKKPKQMPKPHVNNLATGQIAHDEVVDVKIEPLMDLDFKSKAEILGLRTEAIHKYPQLLQGTYQPSNEIFGRIEDGAPWWGTLGVCYYGKGDKSIEGLSEQSLSILNPYLLVVPQVTMVWDPAVISVNDAGNDVHPCYCHARSLRWYPKESLAEVTYDAACVSNSWGGMIELIAYNAKDFGLNYIYVSYKDSSNISKDNEPAVAYNNPQFLHRGGSCGYPGGCNNVSPQTPPIDQIRMQGYPAKIVIRLWQADPKAVEQPPDMTYIIHID